MLNFHTEQWVAAPIERVFAFFSDPNNLPRLMPADRRAHIVDVKLIPPPGSSDKRALAGTGSEITISIRLFPFLPLRGTWVARIVEFEHNSYFADIQVKGPFTSWHHRHEFAREERNGRTGTVVRDVVDYEIGYGVFGILARRFVAKQIAHAFRERQSRTGELLISN